MSDDTDDLTLLAAWRDGDERAGSALFERHFDAVYRFFRNKLEDGVEDLVQQTFLACVRNRDAFRGNASFRTYLYCVARSKLFDVLRTRTRNGADVSLCSMVDLRDSPSTWFARNEQAQLLHLALERLPLELQLVLELFYFEEQPARAVAEILAIPEGTVRSRLRRGLELLRGHVSQVSPSAEKSQEALHSLDEMVATRR